MGEVVGGMDFGDGVSCRWRIEHGKHWSVLEGDPNGHSQVTTGVGWVCGFHSGFRVIEAPCTHINGAYPATV